MDPDFHKILIVGSGPAGLTAAIYAARAQMDPAVFEGVQPGGQLITASAVENFPGFPRGIEGSELMRLLREQARQLGAQTEFKVVTKVDFIEQPLKVWTDDGQLHLSHTVIVATGASYKWLGLESEQKLRGAGVSACATCDGFFHRGNDVALVGGGDTALEEALFLARLASKVTIIHRRNQFRASRIMARRVMNHSKIDIRWNSIVEEVLGNPQAGGVTGVRIRDVNTGETDLISSSGFFVAIGQKPNSDIFKGFLPMDANGYIMTKPGTTQTGVEGVFACGDVQDNTYRQAITAAASGAMAAIEAERWMEACMMCS
jgi:thioredoxin reductase (NADPH)